MHVRDLDARSKVKSALTYPVIILLASVLASSIAEKIEAKPRAAQHMETLAWYFPVVDGKKVSGRLAYAMIVPGSGLVKQQAEAEGLDKIFKAAGFEWREPGCSMCLAMNPDKLAPGERCASTSNRNFEGRQGFKGRTHLVSPAMAAAAAIAGHFVDIRKWS